MNVPPVPSTSNVYWLVPVARVTIPASGSTPAGGFCQLAVMFVPSYETARFVGATNSAGGPFAGHAPGVPPS
jgi:hypothetical protein